MTIRGLGYQQIVSASGDLAYREGLAISGTAAVGQALTDRNKFTFSSSSGMPSPRIVKGRFAPRTASDPFLFTADSASGVGYAGSTGAGFVTIGGLVQAFYVPANEVYLMTAHAQFATATTTAVLSATLRRSDDATLSTNAQVAVTAMFRRALGSTVVHELHFPVVCREGSGAGGWFWLSTPATATDIQAVSGRQNEITFEYIGHV